MGASHSHHRSSSQDVALSSHETRLVALQDGEPARVARIEGGRHLAARLHNLGILPGKRIVKLGTMPGRGPVMLECEGVRVALGRGVASHVVVSRLSEGVDQGVAEA